MAKKKSSVSNKKNTEEKKVDSDFSEEETSNSEESTIDPAIIEDTFTEEADEYNDTDFL